MTDSGAQLALARGVPSDIAWTAVQCLNLALAQLQTLEAEGYRVVKQEPVTIESQESTETLWRDCHERSHREALTDTIYDTFQDSGLLDELDNKQVYEVAHLAAQTIEAVGTTKAIVRAWLKESSYMSADLAETIIDEIDPEYRSTRKRMQLLADAIREVQS